MIQTFELLDWRLPVYLVSLNWREANFNVSEKTLIAMGTDKEYIFIHTLFLNIPNQCWLWDGIFSGSQIPIPNFYFGPDRKIRKIPGIGIEILKLLKLPGIRIGIWKSPKNPEKIPGLFHFRDIPGIFSYLRDQDLFRGMEYPDKKPPLISNLECG